MKSYGPIVSLCSSISEHSVINAYLVFLSASVYYLSVFSNEACVPQPAVTHAGMCMFKSCFLFPRKEKEFKSMTE